MPHRLAGRAGGAVEIVGDDAKPTLIGPRDPVAEIARRKGRRRAVRISQKCLGRRAEPVQAARNAAQIAEALGFRRALREIAAPGRRHHCADAGVQFGFQQSPVFGGFCLGGEPRLFQPPHVDRILPENDHRFGDFAQFIAIGAMRHVALDIAFHQALHPRHKARHPGDNAMADAEHHQRRHRQQSDRQHDIGDQRIAPRLGPRRIHVGQIDNCCAPHAVNARNGFRQPRPQGGIVRPAHHRLFKGAHLRRQLLATGSDIAAEYPRLIKPHSGVERIADTVARAFQFANRFG